MIFVESTVSITSFVPFTITVVLEEFSPIAEAFKLGPKFIASILILSTSILSSSPRVIFTVIVFSDTSLIPSGFGTTIV